MHAGLTEGSSALRREGEVCGALTLCITAVAFQSQSDLTFVQMPKHVLPEAHKILSSQQQRHCYCDLATCHCERWQGYC